MADNSGVADVGAEKVEQLDDTLSPRDQQEDTEDRGLGKRKAEEPADHGYTDYNTKAARRDVGGDPYLLAPLVQDKLKAMQEKGVVRPGELDDRALRDLSGFPADVAVRILDEFEECDMTIVRNKAAFLGGVMNRYLRQPGPKLPHDIQQRLDSMFRGRKLRANDLDAKCYESLSHVPIKAALLALERFGARDLSEIRNISAFFMSMLRSAEKELQTPAGSYGAVTYGRGPDVPVYDSGRSGASYRTSYTPSAGAGYAHGGGMHASRKHHGQDQRLAGVRVDEFHALADCAVNVPAAVALKLQTLWDAGVRLVSQLDDRSWEALADLPAPEGLAAVDETAAAMERPGGLRNINAYFMSVAGKLLNKQLLASRHVEPIARAPAATTSYPDYGRAPAYDEPVRAGYSGTALVQPYRSPSYTAAGVDSVSRGRSDMLASSSSRDPPANRGVCAMHMLTDSVLEQAKRVIARSDHMVRPDHFDEGVCTLLRRLGNDGALAVLDEVLTNDLNVVRNMPAYIMGICKRHQMGRR